MHEALVDNIPATKRSVLLHKYSTSADLSLTITSRDMYYKDVSLFKSQAIVDRVGCLFILSNTTC